MEIKKRLGNLIHAASKTPEPIVTKFGMSDEVGNPYPYAKFYYDPIRSFCFLSHPVSARGGAHKVTRLVFWFFRQPTAKTPAPIFRSIRQMTSFRARMYLLGSPKQNFIFRSHFPPKKANFWLIFDGT